MYRYILIAFFVFLLNPGRAQQNISGQEVQLLGADSTIRLEALGDKLVLIFYKGNCPYADVYKERLLKLQKDFKEFSFILVTAEPTSDIQLKYTIGDQELKLARYLKVTKAPEAVVINRSLVVYKGAIDDNPLVAADVRNKYLEQALTQLRSFGKVTIKPQKAFGCVINN